MDGKEISRVLAKKISEVEMLCGKISVSFGEEDIHKFRTDIKKLRALLRLLKTDDEQTKFKITDKLKRLYHIAGAIRDSQLEQKRLISLGIVAPGYYEHLGNIIGRQQEQWKQHFTNKIFSKLTRRIGDDDFLPVDHHLLDQFIKQQFQAIASILEVPVLSDNQLHSVRKRLKDIGYSLKFYKRQFPGLFEKMKELSGKIDTVAKEIGEYNDSRIHLERQMLFYATIPDEQEKKAMTKIANEEKKRLNNEKKKILKTVNDFMLTATI